MAQELAWRPEIKEAELTLSAHVKEDWLLLGLVMAPKAALQAAPKAQAQAPAAAAAVAPKGLRGDGVMQIDGATLEG